MLLKRMVHTVRFQGSVFTQFRKSDRVNTLKGPSDTWIPEFGQKMKEADLFDF